jgi:hypothetical protein
MLCDRLLKAGCPWFQMARILIVGLSLLFTASVAFAQSSSIGAPMNAATGRSLADAATQNENELLSQQGVGKSSSVSGSAAGMAVFPTGRLRRSEHDGFRPRSDSSFSWETEEASVFANAVVALPGTVLGGQVKLSGFVGHNWLSLDLKSNALARLDTPPQFGHGENESLLVGGTALWAKQGTYALATLIGMWGETRLVDAVDDCNAGPPISCAIGRYKFDTVGFMGTVTGGQVFDLTPGASGLKLDVRGSVSYIQNIGDRYTTTGFTKAVPPTGANQLKFLFSTWTGTGALTLFNNVTLPNNALLRPYIMSYIRQEWSYENAVEALVNNDPAPPTFERTVVQQAHTYGGLDLGLTYALDKMTLGAAIYYESSADDNTLGGRLGMSWKLN